MSDYIKREDAIRAICESQLHTCTIEDCEKGCVPEALLSLPAANVVERKCGKWVFTGNELLIKHSCSECGMEFHEFWEPELIHFCPNCGTQMDGDSDV